MPWESCAQTSVPKLFPAGSYVIAMDTTNQSIPSGKPFNIKAYGLVNYLLQNHIPLSWAIAGSKGKDGVDLSVAAELVYPSQGTVATVDFRAGPFIIDKEYTAKADSIIQNFGKSVAVYRMVQNATADEMYLIYEKPRIAIIAGSTTAWPASMLDTAEFDTALFPSWRIINASALNSSLYSHAVDYSHGGTTDTAVVKAIDTFLLSGGNFFAASNSIPWYENFALWQSNSGINGNLNFGMPVNCLAPSHPIGQYDRSMIGYGGGLWSFLEATTLIPSTIVINEKSPTFRVTTCTDLLPGIPGGMVTYQGGDNPNQVSFETDNKYINVFRIFLNSIFCPTGKAVSINANFATESAAKMWIASTGPFYLGDTVMIALIAYNTGPGCGNTLLLHDTLHPSLVYQSYQATSGTYDTTTGIWNLPGQGLSQTDTLWIAATIADTNAIPLISWINGPVPGNLAFNDTTRDSIQAFFPCVAAAMNDTSICADNIEITAISPIHGTGTWKLVSGAGVLTDSASAITVAHSLGQGSNVFVWNVTDGFCVQNDTVTIKVDLPVLASAGADTFTCTDSIVLNGISASPAAGSWTLVSGSASILNPASANSTVSGFSPGIQTLVWTVVNGLCSDADTVNIEVPYPYLFTAGNDTAICQAGIQLNGSNPGTGSGGWIAISGSAVFSNATLYNTNVSFSDSGLNSLEWRVETGMCNYADTIFIDVDILNAYAGKDTNVCLCDLQLSASPGSGGIWNLIAGSANLDDPADAATWLRNAGSGTITLQWKLTNGNCTSLDSVGIAMDPLPSSAVAGSDMVTFSATAQLAALQPVSGTGTWVVPGNALVSDISDPGATARDLSIGINEFIWTVKSGLCPMSSDTIRITRELLRIPEGISPNGDGANETFVVPLSSPDLTCDIRIADRWGSDVFIESNYDNDWSGQNATGKDLPDDTYYYRLKFSDGSSLNGYVVLKR